MRFRHTTAPTLLAAALLLATGAARAHEAASGPASAPTVATETPELKPGQFDFHPELSSGVWLWMRRAGEPPDDERALFEAGAVERVELKGLDREQASRMVAARLAAPAPRLSDTH